MLNNDFFHPHLHFLKQELNPFVSDLRRSVYVQPRFQDLRGRETLETNL